MLKNNLPSTTSWYFVWGFFSAHYRTYKE